MNRLLLMFCCFMLLFTACKKEDSPTVINPGQANIDDQLVRDYLAANGLTDKAKKVVVGNNNDTTGVWYIVEKEGTASALYSLSSSVTVGYTARALKTGEVIGETGNIHPAYVLGQTMKGWQLGLLSAKVNKEGIVRLFIASRYAYGPYEQPLLGANGLPPNSVLDFTIEIFDVTN